MYCWDGDEVCSTSTATGKQLIVLHTVACITLGVKARVTRRSESLDGYGDSLRRPPVNVRARSLRACARPSRGCGDGANDESPDVRHVLKRIVCFACAWSRRRPFARSRVASR